MAAGWRRGLRIGAALVSGAGAVWQMTLLVRLFAARVRYPWDVEWLEGAALYQAHRVMEGQVTYGPPKLGYLPLMHPPAYPALLGALGKVVGLGYPMARTLSLLFFLGAAGLVLRSLLRHREDAGEGASTGEGAAGSKAVRTPDEASMRANLPVSAAGGGEGEGRLDAWVLGLVAAGCAAAGVPLLLGFYDMVREDTMAVFLCALCAALADTRERRLRPRRIVLLAAVITAIVYTRLPAVFFPVWVTLFVLRRHRKSGLLLALAGISGCGLTLVALQMTSKGWYWMYTVSLLQDHAVIWSKLREGLVLFWKSAPFYPLLLLAALVLAAARRLSARGALWVGMFLCAFPASLLPWAKVGGYFNDFMPLTFFVGPATAFVVLDGVRALGRWPRAAALARAGAHVGLGAYLFLMTWAPARLSPDRAAWKRVRATNATIRQLGGGVIVPRHPFVPVQNGFTTQQFADMPYLDMVLSGYTDLALGAYIDRIHARWAVVSGNEVGTIADEIGSRYQLERRLPDPPRMILGTASTLRYLLKWQDDERGARVLFDFESPMDRWTLEGNAFAGSPALARRPGQPGHGAVGDRLASSYLPGLRDAATGKATSPLFVIDRPKMAMRIGGGWTFKTRVELVVDGKVERKASGIFEGTESMIKVVWDVRPFLGKAAHLVLIDEDEGAWGHLTCDQVVLY